MLKTIIAQVAIVAFSLFPATEGHNATPVELPWRLPEVEVVAKRIKRSFSTTFLDFKLLGKVNTKVDPALETALADFTGPKVRITSLRRYWNNTSQHAHGKAVDFEWSPELIEYLTSAEGIMWLEKHNLMYYIEDTPGSRLLKPFKQDTTTAANVFENPRATGPHVHIGIK